MRELVIAFGLFLFIEGILYALFPAKMKSMLKKLELVKDSQLRSGGLIFAVIGFVIIYYINNFFYVLGTSEKISVLSSIIIPLTILTIINSLFLRNINDK